MKVVNNFLGNNINKKNKMAYKMNGFGGFGNSPAKHTKSRGDHMKDYGKDHTNKDHPDYWKGTGKGTDIMKDVIKNPTPGGLRFEPSTPGWAKTKKSGKLKKSPGKQTKFPDSPKGKTKLQKGEMEGTSITGGNASERLADLGDRIEFLTSDIEGGSDRPGQSISDMKKAKAKLEADLTRLRALYKSEGKI